VEADDHLVAGYFKVEIDGIAAAEFREAEGLTVQREIIEYQEGGENGRTHKLLGPTRWSNIILRHGMTDNVDFFTWMKKTIAAAPVERKNGSIMLVNQKGDVKVRWDFTNGWLCRWEGPRPDSLQNDVPIETLEIAHDGFEMKQG
jgi:phage tail-like protein